MDKSSVIEYIENHPEHLEVFVSLITRLEEENKSIASLPADAKTDILKYQKEKEEHLQRISKLVGVPVSLSIDIESLFKEYSEKVEDYPNQMGEILFGQYLEQLADNLESFVEDEQHKQAFVDAIPKKAISFQFVTELDFPKSVRRPPKQACTFEDGMLTIKIVPSSIWSNLSDLGKDIEPVLNEMNLPSFAPLSLRCRKDLRDNEKNRLRYLKKISNLCGTKYSIGIDVDAFYILYNEKMVSAGEEDYVERMGELLYDNYLSSLADRIEEVFEDDLVKTAFLEASSNRVIQFTFVDSLPFPYVGKAGFTYPYQACHFEGGDLVFKIVPKYAWSNFSDIGLDIGFSFKCRTQLNQVSPSLPSFSPLSLYSRMDLRDSKKSQKEALKQIKSIAGEDFHVHFDDWDAFYLKYNSMVEEAYQERMGDTVSVYLDGLASTLGDVLSDDKLKSSFLRATKNRRITIRFVDSVKNPSGLERAAPYICTIFDSGDLVLCAVAEHVRTNIEDIGNDIPGRLK